MEHLFIFCFKPCLKGNGDKNQLYDELGLKSRRATTDEIKKAYKKKSLSLHPDKLAQRGITATPEHSAQFLKVKEAYEILNDPKRRNLYDQIGYNGLKLLENPTEVDPKVFLENFQKNKRDRWLLLLAVLVVFGLLFLFPFLFVRKCDGAFDSIPWSVTWLPVWIADAILILSAVLLFTMDTSERQKKDKTSSEDLMKNADGEDEDDDSKPHMVMPFGDKVANLIINVLFFLIQVLVFARLDGDLQNTSWFVLFIPWFLYEVATIVASIPKCVKEIPKPDHDSVENEVDESMSPEDICGLHFEAESKHFDARQDQFQDRKSILVCVLRIILACLIASQLDNNDSMNWGIVFAPIWFYFAMEIGIAVYFKQKAAAVLSGMDEESMLSVNLSNDYVTMSKVTQAQQMDGGLVITLAFLASPIFIAVMLVCRLESATYPVFWVLLPIFMVISCCCLGVFCGLVCLAHVDTENLDREFDAHQEEGRRQEPSAYDNSSGHSDIEKGPLIPTDPYIPPVAPVSVPVSQPVVEKPTTVNDVEFDMID